MVRRMMAGAMLAGLACWAMPATSDAQIYDTGATEAGVESTESVAAADDTWTTVGWGALTGLSNLAYVPAKLVYAGMGALTGGIALGLTGGDVTTAQQIWEPSLGGDYFLTPDMIRGDQGVSFAGAPAELAAPADPAAAPPADGQAPDPLDEQHFGS